MTERDLFLSALEIDDPATRQAHLQSACAGDVGLLARVESLLASHESQSLFLQIPAVQQLDDVLADPAATVFVGNGSTEDDAANTDDQQAGADEEIPLGFLQPSGRPNSLGRLHHYEILEVVGRGAFGTVLRAFDDKLQRVVAIKVMASELAATSPARKRFLREARASAQIRHEHVVSVYDVGEKPIPYLVMEFVPGQTLQQRLDQRGPLDLADVLRLGIQIAKGLSAAHAQDLVHRDIKPGNILLETGVQDRVKITDFGLARAADDASMTQSGMIAGTPMYMAPEQALGLKLDQRADLFSLGSVLYQMVSGRAPFRAPSTLAVLKRVTEDTPRPIQEIIPETPDWLCNIIAKLHAKNRDERFQTAREVGELLEQHLAHLQQPEKVPSPPAVKAPVSTRKGRSPRQLIIDHPVLGGVAIVMLLVSVAVATYMLTAAWGEASRNAMPRTGTNAADGESGGDWTPIPMNRVVAGWGLVHDPVGYSRFAQRDDSFRITLPKGDHDLNPLEGCNLDAPRIWEEVEGDFTIQVNVSKADYLDSAQAVSRVGYAFHGAGLVVWQDEQNFVRMLRGHSPMSAQPHTVELHWFEKGNLGGLPGLPDARFLQIERKGPRLTMRTSDNASSWREAGTVDLATQAKLKVGVVAISALDHEAAFRFADRKLKRAVDEAGSDKLEKSVLDSPSAAAADPRESDMQTIKLRSFTPGKDKLPIALRPEGKEVVTVDGDAWRIENSGQGGNFNVMIARVIDDIPQDGVVIFRAKVKVEATDKLTRGHLGFGGANHQFIGWKQWPEVLSRFNGSDTQWVEKEIRHPVAECHETDPPAIYLYAGLHDTGVLWLKDVELLHLPSPPGAMGQAPPAAVAPFDTAQAKEHQKAWAQHLGVPVEYTNSIEMKFRLVPPGRGRSGTPAEQLEAILVEASEESWAHKEIRSEAPDALLTQERPFYLGQCEVTKEQFGRFVAATGYRTEVEVDGLGGWAWSEDAASDARDPKWTWRSEVYSPSSQHPVVFITPRDAQSFCDWLSGEDGLEYRLPTEAAWEWACRAGTTTPWHTGGSPDSLADQEWIASNSPDRSHVVGAKPPNPFGLHDLLGNVSELAFDQRGAAYHRGGTTSFSAWLSRSASRYRLPGADYAHARSGMRIAIVGDLKAAQNQRETHLPAQ